MRGVTGKLQVRGVTGKLQVTGGGVRWRGGGLAQRGGRCEMTPLIAERGDKQCRRARHHRRRDGSTYKSVGNFGYFLGMGGVTSGRRGESDRRPLE